MWRKLGARALGDVLPRHEVRVVLELGDDHDVAGAEVVEAPGVRDEVDRLGRAPGEDHLALGRRVEQPGDGATRPLEALGRALGEPVDAAMDVRVLVLVERAHPVEDLTRLLRRRRRVEVRDRLAVDELVEDREVGAQTMRVEGRGGGRGHAAIVAALLEPTTRPPSPGARDRSSGQARRPRAAARRRRRSSRGSRTAGRDVGARSPPRGAPA